MNDSSEPAPYLQDFLENYWDLIAGTIFAIVAFILHKTGHIYLSTLFAGLGIAAFSFTVSEIAEILAERLQEPYASFVLTFSAVAVEILLLFMILLESSHGSSSALETVKGGIISAVIVDMNVLLGIAVFIGGLRFKEQEHNEDTSSTYTTILLVASVALLVPSLLQYSKDSGESIMTASYIIAFLLMIYYITIFIFQTKTHIHFFKATARSRIFRLRRKKADRTEEDEESEEDYIFEKLPNIANFFAIFGLIFTIGIIAEIFASDGMQIAKNYGISPALAGLVIAIISVSPELFTAIKAAKSDQIQRVVNIAMGASTVSILLTVPILMLLAPIADINLALDFNSLQIGALILTVILAWKTTDNGETNYVEGISHLMFFLAYAVIAAFYH